MTEVRLVSHKKIITRRVDNEIPVGKFLQDAIRDLHIWGEIEITIKFKENHPQRQRKLLPALSLEETKAIHEKLVQDFELEREITLDEFKKCIDWFSDDDSQTNSDVFDEIMCLMCKQSTRQDAEHLVDTLRGRFDFNHTCEDGVSLLMGSACSGSIEMVKYFLEKRVDTEHCCIYGGWTALEAACGKGHTEIVKLLLDAGAKTDYRDYYTTPLIIATEKNHIEVVRLLLDAGAKRNCRMTPKCDNDRLVYSKQYTGQTALEIATEKGFDEIARLIENN